MKNSTSAHCPCVHRHLLLQARPVATAGPFVVHESDAPLTMPQDPELATDSRAVERAEFDAHMAAKMQQEEVGCRDRPQQTAVLQAEQGLEAWSVCVAVCDLTVAPASPCV